MEKRKKVFIIIIITFAIIAFVIIISNTFLVLGIDYLQSNIGSGSSTSSRSLAYSNDVVADNLLIVTVSWEDKIQNVTSVEDTVGSSWLQAYDVVRNPSSSQTMNQQTYYAIAGGSGANTVTVNFTASSTNVKIVVSEYNDTDTTSPLDQVNVTADQGLPGCLTNNVTTTIDDEIIYGVCSTWSSSTAFTPGDGFTEREQVNSGGAQAMQDKIVNSTGSYNATWSVINRNTVWITEILTFKSLPSGDDAPKWQENTTNGTVVGTFVKHSVRWTDDTALDGFIFSFDNGTGTFINDTFVSMTGTNNYSNVTKFVNQTVGSTIQWIVYANDSADQWNNTDTFTYDTTSAPTDSCSCPSINTNWEINLSDSCLIYTDCDIGTGNITFVSTGNATFNATITAKNMDSPPNGGTLFIGPQCLVNLG